MKGIILACMNEMIESQHGSECWEKIIADAGYDRRLSYLATENIDAQKVLTTIKSISRILGISINKVFDAFGEYWSTEFAPRIYSAYYKSHASAKDFIVALDSIHEDTTDRLSDSHPPRFDYDWKDDRTLRLRYKSSRNLIDLAISLLRGIGKHYGETLLIRKLDEDNLEIIFKN
ncbi:MAG: heme NO-binding domain-containing protein [Candidatus Krumholzibacteriota bacterium]|nr:heme NO-binding domain-containing protein [Candidatus Krumholzibacteriota bacterium]